MPNIDVIQPVYYDAEYPYEVYYDNLPLRNIVARQELINSAVENYRLIITEAIGTQGTLSNRLNRSLNPDGSLKTTAVDNSWHNIAYHTDGTYNNGISVIEYVRMQGAERAKLSLIADEATSLAVGVVTPSNITLFEDETIELVPSSTVTWDIDAPNQIKAHLTFPITALHNHYYDQIPAHYTPSTPDFQNYKVNSLATPFKENSLRVYINGTRLSSSSTIYVPSANGPQEDWRSITFTPDHANGLFTLSRSIVVSDVIRIDYDIDLG